MSVRYGMMYEDNEASSTSGTRAVFGEGGVVGERLEGAIGGEFSFLNAGY